MSNTHIIQYFNFNNDYIRVLLINGEPWFVAADICYILEIDVNDALKRLKSHEISSALCGTESKRATSRINQKVKIITDVGLYRLVLRSDKSQAEPFQDWVTQDVLVSIRKTGSYTLNNSPQLINKRISIRGDLKNKTRLELTDQVKKYLEDIKLYSNKQYVGYTFAQIHDLINVAITGETAKEMRQRAENSGINIKKTDLLRDYFPILIILQKYICLCKIITNLIIEDNLTPFDSIKRGIKLGLPASYKPEKINFECHIKELKEESKPLQLNFFSEL